MKANNKAINKPTKLLTLRRAEKLPVLITGRMTHRKRKTASKQMSTILSPLTSGDMGVWWAPLIRLSVVVGTNYRLFSSSQTYLC